MQNKILQYLPGLGLTILLALISYLLSPYMPGFGAVVIGLILGVVLGNLVALPERFQTGLKFSSGKILEAAIVLMAFEINLGELSKVGLPILSIVLVAVAFILFATIQLSNRMSCPGANGWLIGFGTSICGSAAISAIGPLITKDKAQIGISLAVINILGGLGIFAVPSIVAMLQLDPIESGIFIGGSLHSMGHVAGAGELLNEEVRNVAISVKLVRIALLTPALLIFSHFVNVRHQEVKSKFKLQLPAYLLIFVLISLLTSFFDIPKEFNGFTKKTSAFLLTISMVAIGANISFKHLIQSGTKAIIFGAILFFIFLIMLLLLIQIFL
jgi:uncharacterized integral membrane protein (TIGR00698 family)